jgi:hypothetical protein
MKTFSMIVSSLALALLSNVALAVQEKGEEGTTAQRCRRIHATISSNFVPADQCASPVHLCTAGNISGSLNGTTAFEGSGVSGTPQDPTGQNSFSYAGNLTITTPRGVLNVVDLGVFINSSGYFTEESNQMTGTDAFEGVTGEIFISGQSTQTGLKSEMKGELCF